MRILHLVPKDIYDCKMSRVRFHAIEAIGKKVPLKYDGPGWAGYKGIQDSCNTFKPNLIITYLFPGTPKDRGITIPLCTIFNEMYNIEQSLPELNKLNPDIVIHHYKNDMNLWKEKTGNMTFIHLPQCAEKTIFKDYQKPKKYDILLTGVLSPEYYPFRYRLHNIVKNHLSKKWRYHVRPHPGYKKSKAYNNNELINYAQMINESQITLACTSKFKYALGKYAEIPMCNSVLAGDIPDERQEFFRSFMLELNPKNSDLDIAIKIDNFLKDKNKVIERSKKGMDLVTGNYTHEHYAERFLKKIENYLGGKR